MWKFKDAVLQAIHSNGADYQNFSDLQRKFPQTDPNELQSTIQWLARHDLIDGQKDMQQTISTFKITRVGEDLADTETSVETLVRQFVNQHITNYQHNINYAPSVNAQGDCTVINDQQVTDSVEQVVDILSKYDKADLAKLLKEEEAESGPRAALTKAVEWTNDKLFAPSVLAATIQQIARAAGIG